MGYCWTREVPVRTNRLCSSVAKSYYRAAIGVIIVYDITRPETFQHVPNWLNDAKNLARSECSICVVGNKSDLKENRVVKYNDGAKFCQENSTILY
jgi:GTPase SAR1 family protein